MADKPPLASYFSDAQTPDLDTYFTPQKNPAKQPLDWSNVPFEAAQNLWPSAKRFGSSIYQAVTNPTETATNLGRLSMGIASKIAPGSLAEKQYGPYADAAWAEIVNRYGGWENLKHTIAEDPVGFAADISTIAAPFESLATVPGKVGKVGEIMGTVSKAANPLTLPATGAKFLAEAGGKATGAGAANILNAYRAGATSPTTSRVFRENISRPEEHAEAIVPRALAAVDAVGAERSAAYKAGMAKVGQNMKVLKFNKIDAAMKKAEQYETFQGQDINKLFGQTQPLPSETVRVQMRKMIDAAKQLDPKTYHTAIGFDALKKAIGNQMEALPAGSPERAAAEVVYHAVRQTIIDGDKNYAKVMKAYEDASAQLREFKRTLSLKKGGTEDTALRKLLSAGRSGVNTNFGRRGELVKALNQYDPSILPALAGQSLHAPFAHGLAGIASTGGATAALTGVLNPKFLATVLATSPRLWGEIAHATGVGVRQLKNMSPAAITQAITVGGKINPELLKAIVRDAPLATRAAGAPSRLRIDVGTGETTNAPQ